MSDVKLNQADFHILDSLNASTYNISFFLANDHVASDISYTLKQVFTNRFVYISYCSQLYFDVFVASGLWSIPIVLSHFRAVKNLASTYSLITVSKNIVILL